MKKTFYALLIALALSTPANAGKGDLLTKEALDRADAQLAEDAFYDLLGKTVLYVACRGIKPYSQRFGVVLDALETVAPGGLSKLDIIAMIATRSSVVTVDSGSNDCYALDEILFGVRA